jgi:hypothetical protein
MAILKLRNLRLSFPKIWELDTTFDHPAYSANFLVAADDPQLDTINDAIEAVAKEQWKDKYKTILAQLRAQDRVCLHDGDAKAQYDGYPGNWYISSRNKSRPLILDRDKSPLTEKDGRPYGGCYVNVSLDIWVQDPKGEKAKNGKRINATLRGIQFMADGDAFAGGAPADPEEFDDLGVGDASSIA